MIAQRFGHDQVTCSAGPFNASPLRGEAGRGGIEIAILTPISSPGERRDLKPLSLTLSPEGRGNVRTPSQIGSPRKKTSLKTLSRKGRGSRLGHARPGFTLLEVILAVALAGALLVVLGFGMHLYMRATNVSRTGVEEAKLARNVLRMVANDLRGVVLYEPQDVSGVMQPSQGGGGQGGGGGGRNRQPTRSGGGEEGGGEEGGGDSAGGGGGSGGAGGSGSGEELTTPDTSPMTSAPGLYGTMYELQMDVSRLPRLDEVTSYMSGNVSAQSGYISDIKNVSYYVRQGALYDPQSAVPLPLLDPQLGGLVRRSVDRTSAVWATEQGDAAIFEQGEKLLAPEVVAIEFQFFDGVQWLAEWDSQLNGGLPLAVEVVVYIAPVRDGSSPADEISPATLDAIRQTATPFRMLVHLPTAQAAASSSTTGAAGATGGAAGSTTGAAL
ncbi:MAG: prepilin-type N-terminal cleavage/methylation domain-containing protein [Pirellulales bacterium]